MATTPERVKLSKADLRRKYEEGKWPEKLEKCTKVTIHSVDRDPSSGNDTLRERGYKYLDAQGELVAVEFYYDRMDGAKIHSIRLLIEDGAWYEPSPV